MLSSRIKQGFFTGAVCALIVFVFQIIGRLDGLERGSLDTFFQVRGPRYPSPHVIILEADDATVARYGRWPLPRTVYADVISRLHRAGVKTIALDILFTRESATNVKHDEKLIQACREAGNVVHAAAFTVEFNPVTNVRASGISSTLSPRFAVNDPGVPCRTAISASAALPVLLKSAAGLGHVNVFPEWDGALRRIPHLILYRGRNTYPSLALATAAHYLGITPQQIKAEARGDGSELSIAGRRISLDPDGEAIVNWIGENRSIPTFTFNELFDGEVPPEILKDRVVLLGVTAAGAYEHHATPFSPNQPAVELQANALDDILSNRLLRAAPRWSQFLLLLLFPCLIGALLLGRSAKAVTLLGVAMCTVLWGVGAMLLAYANYYLPVAAPLLAAVLTGSAAIGQQQIGDARRLKRTVTDLKLAEERYALAERGANDGLWDWDLQTDVIYYSPRWKDILGYGGDEIGHSVGEWFNRVHPDDISSVKAELQLHLDGQRPHFECEFRMRHKDGSYRWLLCRGLCVHDENGQPVRMAGSQTDSTDRKTAELSLLHSAFHDDLTDLPNRALFMDRVEQALARTHRNPNRLFAVLYFDIDNFKTVNDSLGHAVGNQLLVGVAQRLNASLRAGDTAARQGGDEFTLLLNDITTAEDAMLIVERMQQEMAEPFDLDGSKVFITVSMGIAFSTARYEHPEDLVRDADMAMYRAKAAGAGRHQVFDVEMHERAVSLLRLQTELRFAIERREFQAHYQPIVSLATGRISGFEALVRWQHPERGFVGPGEFIPVAEDTGLILLIDRLILEEACRQTHSWHQQFAAKSAGMASPLTISVNLSTRQFAHTDLLEQVHNIVNNSGIDPRSLKLEITEGAIMENAESTASMLMQLKSLGLELSIDDFGTGYSSLSYLHRFPLDILKIDRSFVNRLGGADDNIEIVQAIITLARNLGLKVVAEGIESEQQLAQLRSLGCDYGQGYFFSKPLARDEATTLLEQVPKW